MELHINIGTPKACLFVFMSNKLLGELRRYPLLYYAVEEALISAKNGYYSIGIIVWYELIKSIVHASSKKDANERNIPAHDILKIRPKKESYENLLNKFEEEAKKCYLKELSKAKNNEAYTSNLQNDWKKFIQKSP